jgi:dihydrofolate synthase/folylpolyglutamate synthase
MTYAAAIQFLYGLSWFGARFGLETTRQLAARVGNPQEHLRFIHVAGTNGKGSTCAMLESIYRAAGFRVGLFTSPHLVSFRERIQVNRQLISPADVVRLVAELQRLERRSPDQLDASPSQRADLEIGAPTLFEFVTVMALRYFAEQKCDLVIWETGLGGRLDATNIVTPLASVITNIGLDHQQWLGDTLPQIAAEKAGIIKPGVPVLTTASQPEVLAVIQSKARSQQSPLTIVSPAAAKVASPALLGEHQQSNTALALATVETLQPKIPVAAAAMERGLQSVCWPGRLQLLIRPDGRRFLLDGAHNPAGAEVLRAALLQHFAPQPRTLILGMLGDKDWRAMCQILAPLADRILLVPVGSERTAPPQALAESCRSVNPRATVRSCASLPDALTHAAADSLVVIAGSLYLIGTALALLDPEFADSSNEQALNEWVARPKETEPPSPAR